MKIRTFYFYFVFVLILLSCNNEIYIDNLNNENNVATRAIKAQTTENYYYYYKGTKQYISINPSKRYIIAKQNIHTSQCNADNIVREFANGNIGYIVETEATGRFLSSDSTTPLINDSNIIAIESVIGDSILLPCSNIFYIKLKETTDITLLKDKIAEIRCVIEGKVETDNSWIRVSCNKYSRMNSLDASNYLYETGLLADVDPGFDFDFKSSYIPSDAMYSQQWGLNGRWGIHPTGAWDITKGESSITVAVIDQGIYTQHSELNGKMHSYSYDCSTGTSVASSVYQNHATMIAGIIAANHNNNMIAGIAPNIKLMNIKRSSTSNTGATSLELHANAINKAWQNGADIINNSWGSNTNQHSAVLESAINNALIKGRNGKGCIVCFAAGNDRVITYPGNCNPDILVVGASNSSGRETSFSGRGNELDVLAPGEGILSIDATGGTFTDSGTSFATPHVAGIAALMLSVNPNLSQEQVSTIMKETCTPVTYYGSGWNKNSGNGIVNATKAVKVAAKQYSIIGGPYVHATAKFYIDYAPEGAEVRWSTGKNISRMIYHKNDTIEYYFDFDTRMTTDEVKAKITYLGQSVNITLPITIFNEPQITGVQRIDYDPSADNRYDLKVSCSDPNAIITWSGDGNFIDFPYAGDASFMDHPNLYKSVTFFSSGVHALKVKANNTYGSDEYQFQIDNMTSLYTFSRKDTIGTNKINP